MSADKQQAAARGAEATPLFKPFEWVAPRNQPDRYQMLSDVRDLAAGVQVALQMVERSNMQEENSEAPLLDLHSKFYLTRMSIAAMSTITERIEAHFDFLTEQGDKP